jgi:hypothetical protein
VFGVKTAFWLRLVVYVLIAAAILIALVPLLVLLSLVRGGTGFGLCPGGLGTCRNPYTAAPELSLGLTVGLLVIVAAIRVVMRMARKAGNDSQSPEPSSSMRETR